jgi:pilus assembly protein CpaB
MSLKVPEGMRAFSIHVNEVVGVGGFIVPDARVDVVLTTASPLGGQVSKIVLEDIRVLAAGQTSEQKENKPITVNTVTLAVTPEDAEKLALASNDGKIQLVLRNFMDNTVVSTPGIDKHRLLASHRFDPPAQAEKAPARPKRSARAKASPDASGSPSPGPKGHVVEVIKGTKRSAETFE